MLNSIDSVTSVRQIGDWLGIICALSSSVLLHTFSQIAYSLPRHFCTAGATANETVGANANWRIPWRIPWHLPPKELQWVLLPLYPIINFIFRSVPIRCSFSGPSVCSFVRQIELIQYRHLGVQNRACKTEY